MAEVLRVEEPWAAAWVEAVQVAVDGLAGASAEETVEKQEEAKEVI